jgi:hypothetical protein
MDHDDIKKQVLRTLQGGSNAQAQRIHRYWYIHELVISDAPLTPEHAQYLESWLNSSWPMRAKTMIGPDGNIYNASHDFNTMRIDVTDEIKTRRRREMKKAHKLNIRVIHEKNP